VLNTRPRDPDLLVRVGKGWLALGDEERALPLLQRASQLKALDAETSALLARQLYRTRQYEEALRVYWALYQVQPTNPDLPGVLPELVLSVPATLEQRTVAASFALRSGRLEQAAELLEAKLAAAPRDTETRMQLAEVYLRQDRLPQAEAVLQAPDASSDSDVQGLQLLANVQERMGRWPALAKTLQRLQSLRPDDAELSRRRGLLLAQLRRSDEARPLLDRALLDSPRDVTLRMALADVTLALGDTAAAESHLKTVLAEQPGQSEAQRRLIELLMREQRWVDVAIRLETWVAANPRDATARYNLVTAYLKEFRSEAARPHYEALQQLAPVRAKSLEPYFRR
jgi:thioredoxin-like negative regulator of GroEL